MRRSSLLASALALALPLAKMAAPISAGLATPSSAELAAPVYAERGHRRGPPPEALEACAAAEEDAACGFTSPRGDEVAGTCLEKREQLVCVPEGGRRGHGPRGGSNEG
jgi:hypothetical protein